MKLMKKPVKPRWNPSYHDYHRDSKYTGQLA